MERNPSRTSIADLREASSRMFLVLPTGVRIERRRSTQSAERRDGASHWRILRIALLVTEVPSSIQCTSVLTDIVFSSTIFPARNTRIWTCAPEGRSRITRDA